MGSSLKQKKMKIVTVANQKGGVGKTSSIIQLASGLAKRGERVLAVDGDPQGNLSLFFGAAEGQTFGQPIGQAKIPGFHDLLASIENGKPSLKNSIRKSVRRRLDLIPFTDRDFRINFADDRIRNLKDPFAKVLSKAANFYDWILIDSSPSNSCLERLLVEASDAVIIPLEFQLFSVSGLEASIQEVDACSQECGRGIEVHSLLFTKAENRLNRVQDYRRVFSTFRIPIFEVCKSEYMSRSLEKSRTIWECGPSSNAAKDYARIIEKSFLEIV